jgi:hypothetical protein
MSEKSKKFNLESKKEKIIIKVKDVLLSSTSHGLPNVLRTPRKSIKCMWLLLFLIFSSIGSYMVYKTISNYLEYEIVTKIEYIRENPIEFPAVTIRNLRNSKNVVKLKDLIVFCIFDNKICDENDFETSVNSLGLYSYKLKRKKSNLPGPEYGLSLGFHLGNDTSGSLALDGLQVVVHNHSSFPGFYMGYGINGHNVAPGYATNLEIKRIHTNKLNVPSSFCLKDTTSLNSFDSDLYRYMITSTNFTYNQKDCFNYHLGREMNKYLNITNKIDDWMTVFSKKSHSKTLIKLMEQNFKGNFTLECPLECDSVRYDVSISFSKIIPEGYIKFLKENDLLSFLNPKFKLSTENDSKNLATISVFYNDLEYTRISQLPKMDFFDLISNIGGNLGLFIGISFLSFAEIIELFIETFYILFEKNRNLINK